MYPTSHLYATLLLCRLLIVGELNSFVIVVSVEADTVVAVIVSRVLTVEAVPAKRCRSFVLSQRQGYKNYHRHNRILLWFHLRRPCNREYEYIRHANTKVMYVTCMLSSSLASLSEKFT